LWTKSAENSKYLRAGATNNVGVATSVAASMLTGPKHSNGDHTHNWQPNYMNPGRVTGGENVHTDYVTVGTLGEAYDGLTGAHTHTISASLTDNIKRVYTTAWTKITDFYGFRGMIGFWDGALAAIPEGWAICDGTNNTIDMRDYFIVMGTDATKSTRTGSNLIDIIPSGTNMLASNDFTALPPPDPGHVHFEKDTVLCSIPDTGSETNNNRNYKFWHAPYRVPHFHAGTQGTNLSYVPPYYALYVIQKL
jgi:hypothetical protein